MNNLDEEIKKYLPQYLSEIELNNLREELSKFPTDGTKDTVYTIALSNADYLLQGDGVANLDYINFPDVVIKPIDVILLSNTCDMSIENKRMNPCRIMYAPILKFDKYARKLRESFPSQRVDNHLRDIKAQQISQAMFLPKGGKMDYDGIVFFDRAISIPLSEETMQSMCDNKLFTLSNFGLYLLLLKLSIHFTRIQERIDRTTGEDLGQTKVSGDRLLNHQ